MTKHLLNEEAMLGLELTVPEVGAHAARAPYDHPERLYDAYRKVRTFGSLDGLRALSIIAVIWHHTRDTNTPITSRVWPTNFGFLSVDLFFMVSGFLIVTLLLRQRDKNAGFSLPNFYARRGLRIFPLYYALLLVFACFYLPSDRPNAVAFKQDLPYLLVYLTNWHHAAGMFHVTWTLSAEEQFYLLWPPVERFFARRALPLLLGLLVITQLIHFGAIDPLLARWFGWGPNEPEMLRFTTFTPIIFGVLIAHMLHHRASYLRVAPALAHPVAAPLALLAMFVAPSFFPLETRGLPRLTSQIIMLLVIATAVVREDHHARRLLAWAPLSRIGVLSYGLYLMHHTGISIVDKLLQRVGLVSVPFIHFVLGSAVTYVMAELSYRHFESRFLKLKERFP